MYLSLSLSLYLSLSSSFFLVRSCLLITLIKLAKVTSLSDGSLKVLSKCICLCLCLCLCHCHCLCLCHCPFLVWSCLLIIIIKCPKGSQVSGIALWRCSLNVFVFVFVFVFVLVFVFVIVFVIVFLLVRSCPLITLIKCLKGHKSLGSLFEGAL